MKQICYLSLGYPTVEKSMEMVDCYFNGGADGVEICIPCSNPFAEKDTIKNWMIQSYNEVGSYRVYMDAIRQITAKYPGKVFYVMVYGEAIQAIGIENFITFYKEAGLSSVISISLTDEMVDAFTKAGVGMCAFSGQMKVVETLQSCIDCKGFIYMGTTPLKPGVVPPEGFETVEKCIRYLREHGVTAPIYCGGGISSPEKAKYMKDAGADGFFVGTALIDLAHDYEALTKFVAEYKAAIR